MGLSGRLKRFRRSPTAVVGLAIVLLLVLGAVVGPALTPYDPYDAALSQALRPPGGGFVLGTDDLGRDLLTRILYGSRLALGVAVMVLAIAVTTGVVVGSVAGFLGGWVDEIVMRVTDMFLAFPPLVLALAVAAALGPSLVNAMIAMAIVWWPWYARVVRGQVITVKNEDYVTAARSLGAREIMVLLRHVLPNCLLPIIVQCTLDLGTTMLTAASLGFVGLGAQPPQPDWGLMVATGRQYMLSYWWVPTFPGAAIFISVMGFNLLGDGLRDLLDVQLGNR